MANQKPLILSSTGQYQRLPTSDIIDPAALATGTANATTFLRGDGTWSSPSASSLAISSLTAATSANTLASADYAQTWQWALTSITKSALTLTESSASINGGSNQVLVDITTLATSTATPLKVTARGTEAFRVNYDGVVSMSNGATILGNLGLSTGGIVTFGGRYDEVVNARGSISGAQTINNTLGTYVTATITGAVTFTFTNPATSGTASGFILELTNGGAAAITWPGSVKWPSGTAPTLTAAGVDMLLFTTRDGGTTWRGTMTAKDSK